MTWREILRITVPGIPKAQPRARAFARVFGNGKPTARMYDPGTAEAWKSDIARAFEGSVPASPLEGPIRVDVDFIFPRPGKLMRRRDPDGEIPHLAKPDRDNCEKALLDALKTIGVFRDDCQVCAGEVRKFYHAKAGKPGARVTISVPGSIQAAPANLPARSDPLASANHRSPLGPAGLFPRFSEDRTS